MQGALSLVRQMVVISVLRASIIYYAQEYMRSWKNYLTQSQMQAVGKGIVPWFGGLSIIDKVKGAGQGNNIPCKKMYEQKYGNRILRSMWISVRN